VPELPEVEGLRGALEREIVGEQVARCELASVSALKTFEPPIDALAGRKVSAVERFGKLPGIRLAPASDHGRPAPGSHSGDLSSEPGDDLWLVIHLSRGGWLRWHDKVPPSRGRPGRGPLVLRIGFRSGAGFDVTEMGTQKRLSLWVVREPRDVPVVASLGPDALAAELDGDRFAKLLASSSSTVKRVLTDQQLVAGIGNAYSDELLHAARLSPFRPADRLEGDEVDRLYGAMRQVLGVATARLQGRSLAQLKNDKKEQLAVHGRGGQSCPVCGDVVRDVWFADRSLQYCPTCQTGGRRLADRRLSRLVK
jgi:formamidopyrimidine-DNA glycosylase